MKDYYKILEVEENATDDDIKKNYRILSKKFHPDLNPEGSEKFKEIAEAYEILGDKTKREQYNLKRKNPNFSNNFEDLFSQMFGGNQMNQPRRKSAPDKIIKLQISPVDSFIGSEKIIQYNKENSCPVCNGSGGEQQICGICGGAGFQMRTFGTGFMVQQVRMSCNNCGGKGFNLLNKCYTCDGHGSRNTVNEIKIKLPEGIDNGQYLRLANLGDFKNGDYGDLIIQVEVIPKDGYEKMNKDLIYTLVLDLESIQREKFIVPHPDGNLSFDAPRIIDTSKPLRMRGKGYSGGDFYVKLNLKFERPI